MKQYTEAERAALIADCEAEIQACKDKICAYESRLGWDRAEKEKSVLARQEIAMAALTQKPVAYRWEVAKTGRIGYDGIKPVGVDGQPLYTAPPVAALRLPDGWIRCSERLPEGEESVMAYWPHSGHVEDVIFVFDEENPEQRHHMLYDGERMSTEPSHWMPFTAPSEEKK